MAIERAAGYTNHSGGAVNPESRSDQLAEVFVEQAVVPNITTSKWEKDAKETEAIVIKFPPKPTLRRHVKMAPIVYESPEVPTAKIYLDNAWDYAMAIDIVDDKQSDMNLPPLWVSQAALASQEKVDEIVLAGMVTQVDESNCGNAAGNKSGAIVLGTGASPRQFKTDDALEIVTDCGVALREHSLAKKDFFIVLPSWAVQRCALSPLSKANEMGDSKSVLRGGAIGEIDHMMVHDSNLVLQDIVDGTRVWYCPFGWKGAAGFAWQFQDDRVWEKHPAFHGSAVDGIINFGYKVVSPKYAGCLVIKR